MKNYVTKRFHSLFQQGMSSIKASIRCANPAPGTVDPPPSVGVRWGIVSRFSNFRHQPRALKRLKQIQAKQLDEGFLSGRGLRVEVWLANGGIRSRWNQASARQASERFSLVRMSANP
jgi:hypothetical protein